MVDQQQIRDCFTLIENLPNELFLGIFSYLTTIDTFIAFINLNYRFQCLILDYCRSFDFTAINKTQFDRIFQHHNTNQWYSLKLSDDKQTTPGQLKYFFENYSLDKDFSQLRTLSLVHTNPSNDYSLFTQLLYLTNLISLKLESICGLNFFEFDLPNLKKLSLTSCADTTWLKDFSQLETIECTITNSCSHNKILIWPKTLKNLKITYQDANDCLLIQQSLTNLSQLVRLEIYQNEKGLSYPNGQIWEQIILSSLPLLQNFQFYFQFKFYPHEFNRVKQITRSFSTPFYVLEKNWFIHCDVSAGNERHNIDHRDTKFAVIYTVPISFDKFLVFKTSSKLSFSNCMKTDLNQYAKVKSLVFKNYTKPDQNFNKSNVINLTINTPFDSVDWIHVLTKLRHLTIDDGAVLTIENFNLLLDNTPDLSSLTTKKSMLKRLTDNWTDICICNHLSRKICSLILHADENSLQYFNKNELEKILPIFSSKCQHLSLGIHSRNNAIEFILHEMPQLISLHLHIQQRNCSPITIEWLEEQQTRFHRSNCIIINDKQDHYFWLG